LRIVFPVLAKFPARNPVAPKKPLDSAKRRKLEPNINLGRIRTFGVTSRIAFLGAFFQGQSLDEEIYGLSVRKDAQTLITGLHVIILRLVWISVAQLPMMGQQSREQ
jgi:hypothetical protein